MGVIDELEIARDKPDQNRFDDSRLRQRPAHALPKTLREAIFFLAPDGFYR
jgi:hypothetical protein